MKSARDEPAGLAQLLAAATGGGTVLAIDAPLAAQLPAVSVRELPAPGDEGSIPNEEDAVDAAVVGGLGALSPLALARALSRCVRPGGAVVFAIPTTRRGLRGATGSLLGMLRRKRPVLFEELCEALLIAGLGSIEARELDDSSGTSLVWGRVRAAG